MTEQPPWGSGPEPDPHDPAPAPGTPSGSTPGYPPPPSYPPPGYPPAGYPQQAQPGAGWGPHQPGQPSQPGAWGFAPYGVHPMTGMPYSEKSKIVAGLLQVLLPLGLGRFYTGHTAIGIAQLLVTLLTCGVGALWPFVDGIVTLVTDSTDAEGRPLRS